MRHRSRKSWSTEKNEATHKQNIVQSSGEGKKRKNDELIKNRKQKQNEINIDINTNSLK